MVMSSLCSDCHTIIRNDLFLMLVIVNMLLATHMANHLSENQTESDEDPFPYLLTLPQ